MQLNSQLTFLSQICAAITISHFSSTDQLPLLSFVHNRPAAMSGRGKGKTAKKAVSRSSKAGLQFPVGRIARYLKKGKVSGLGTCGTPVYSKITAPVLHLLASPGREAHTNRT